jgi:hypothetical protein
LPNLRSRAIFTVFAVFDQFEYFNFGDSRLLQQALHDTLVTQTFQLDIFSVWILVFSSFQPYLRCFILRSRCIPIAVYRYNQWVGFNCSLRLHQSWFLSSVTSVLLLGSETISLLVPGLVQRRLLSFILRSTYPGSSSRVTANRTSILSWFSVQALLVSLQLFRTSSQDPCLPVYPFPHLPLLAF